MHLSLKWEFPGGKVEAHTYPDQKSFELIPFRCNVAGGELDVKEHKVVKWLNRSEFRNLDWAEADIPVLNHYLTNYG